jgi:UDP-GlcNAc:undecaprenyl-phosphate/decaprenyl-phosphate GlcNAc-1-phosphate transferase
LAVLSVMGGAKLALALMVLGVPILDVAIVIINRVRRGQSPLHYDKTHLHHRLMATGLSVKQICYVLYGLALLFGLLALSISGIHSAHLLKFVGVAMVGITMAGLVIWIDHRQRRQGLRIRLGGPEPHNGNGDVNGNLNDKVVDEDGNDGASGNKLDAGVGDASDERKDAHYIFGGSEREV